MAEQKGQPFSVRFTKRLDQYVEEEARRLRRSKSSLVEELTEEAAKVRRFPGIVFHGGAVTERRAHIASTGLDAWELNMLIDDYGSIEAVLENFPKVKDRHCRLAVAYRRAYPDEVDVFIAGNRRPVEEMETLYPWVDWSAARQRTAR